MSEFKRYLKFLNEKKKLIGLADWEIQLEPKFVTMGDCAAVNIDIYEKTMKIKLGNKFKESNSKMKKNILMHELVHGKIAAYNEEILDLVRMREEHLVNDLTKGYEKLL
jgi:hypothetical protein